MGPKGSILPKKKRKTEDKWKKNVTKKLKNSGLEYVSESTVKGTLKKKPPTEVRVLFLIIGIFSCHEGGVSLQFKIRVFKK